MSGDDGCCCYCYCCYNDIHFGGIHGQRWLRNEWIASRTNTVIRIDAKKWEVAPNREAGSLGTGKIGKARNSH